MFDEQGEAVLHETDLHARLATALDGPAAWIKWDLARAIARNIKFKLEDPPKRPLVTGMYDRAVLELAQLFHTFPRLPEHWMHGARVDDPSVRCLLHPMNNCFTLVPQRDYVFLGHTILTLNSQFPWRIG